MRVFVYFNLHKKLFSVKALEGPNKGRVVAHAHDVFLQNVRFKVSEAGRLRVIREQRKNVHAGVVGDWSENLSVPVSEGSRVTYNPYKYTSFVTSENAQPVHAAKWAWLRSTDRSVLAAVN